MMPVRSFATQNWLPTMFNDFFNSDWMPRVETTTPYVNVLEDENEYKVEFAVPGMSKDDFKVQVNDNNTMVVSVEKNSKNEKKDGKKYLRREFSYTNFTQTFALPDNVDKKDIAAKVDNGMLIVNLPKMKEEQKADSCRYIEIK